MTDEEYFFTCPSCGGHYFGTWSHRRKDGTLVDLSLDCHDQYEVGCKETVILEASEDNPVTFQDFVDAKHPHGKTL